LRCLIGRFEVYPRFRPRTDRFRTRENKREEQNEERGGSPLADYQSYRSSCRDYLHMQKQDSLKRWTQLSPPTSVIHGGLQQQTHKGTFKKLVSCCITLWHLRHGYGVPGKRRHAAISTTKTPCPIFRQGVLKGTFFELRRRI
jgi:hypothetical protein